jgi:hypothetical protein
MNNSTLPRKSVPSRGASDDAQDADGSKRDDFLTRYFLRRLAIARRKARFASAQYRTALVDVICFAIAFPVLGLLSFGLVLSLRWMTPAQAAAHPIPSKYIIAGVVMALSFVVGHRLLGPKFEKYIDNPTACPRYDNDHDRRAAAFQKTAGFVISAIVMPWLAFMIAFWDRL